MAGFGGGGAKSRNDIKNKKQKDTPIKLKPKLQWDRYSALKNADKAQVGIRLTNDDAGATSSDWLEVGRVKIKDSENVPLAVAIQRAIIAEVSSSFLQEVFVHVHVQLVFKMCFCSTCLLCAFNS
jgi:hypothetical protein